MEKSFIKINNAIYFKVKEIREKDKTYEIYCNNEQNKIEMFEKIGDDLYQITDEDKIQEIIKKYLIKYDGTIE